MSADARPITYWFFGEITEVQRNDGDAIPGLAIGDTFDGYTTFEAGGWNGTAGTVQATINGVNLIFTGDSIYGGVSWGPGLPYSIRVAGDRAGAGSSIAGSTFSAGNFGSELTDTDASAGIVEPFPSQFDLNEFETNVFSISGSLIGSNDRVGATGTLTRFARFPVPEPSTAILAALGLLAGARRRC